MEVSYADGFNIMTGLVDAKIDILSIDPVIDPKGQIQGESRVVQQRIIMSMPTVKEFAAKLQEVVDQYEATFGKIVDLSELREKVSNNG